jgi:rod shape-determining protein MreC
MARDNKLANTLLLIFGGISVVLMLLPMTGKVQYLRVSMSYLLNPVPYYGGQAFSRFATMPADVARLISGDIELLEARRRLKEGRVLESEIAGLRRENERLRSALAISSAAPSSVGWARIMARDPLNWHRSIMISAGEDRGVEISAPVLGLQEDRLAVIGRVIEVGGKASKVLLLTDERSEIAAYLPEANAEGLVEGRGSGLLRMNYLPPEGKLEVGSPVYTSPTSATFGRDMLIGTISRIFPRDPFLQFQSVEVTPAVRASALKEIMVLVPHKAVEE